MSVGELKREMIQVYGKNCWLNEFYIPSKHNKITYHHIIEKRNGGLVEWENGALLCKNSHIYLHQLEIYYPDEYKELNKLFYWLNLSYNKPTQEYYQEVNKVLKRTL